MNLSDIFSIVNRRLSNITRFNNTPRICKETVAEHSYFVAFCVMLLSDFLENVNLEKALKLALIHDVEEAISGDLPHDVKMKYPSFNVALEEMNLSIAHEIFGDQIQYIDLWEETRDTKTIEAKLVKFADMFSVLMYCNNEINMGNSYMKDIYSRQLKLINEFIKKNSEFTFAKRII